MAKMSANLQIRQILYNISKHPSDKLLFSSVFNKKQPWVISSNNYATKAEKKRGIDRKPTPKVEHTMQSVAAKGFLRPTQDYTPPANFKADLHMICTKHLQKHEESSELGEKKVDILIEAAAKFNFAVPNSLLHQVNAVSDLISFYGQESSTKTPLDKMKNMELPPNLHVQYEYKRWHPATDTKFGGVTAFPESSTLVTGLKYREKYKGHKQNVKVPRE